MQSIMQATYTTHETISQYHEMTNGQAAFLAKDSNGRFYAGAGQVVDGEYQFSVTPLVAHEFDALMAYYAIRNAILN
jgi:hypothetical protein